MVFAAAPKINRFDSLLYWLNWRIFEVDLMMQKNSPDGMRLVAFDGLVLNKITKLEQNYVSVLRTSWEIFKTSNIFRCKKLICRILNL